MCASHVVETRFRVFTETTWNAHVSARRLSSLRPQGTEAARSGHTNLTRPWGAATPKRLRLLSALSVQPPRRSPWPSRRR